MSNAILGAAILGEAILGQGHERILDIPPSEPIYQFRARASETLETLAILTEYRSVSYELPMYRLGGFQASIIFRQELLDWANNEGVLEIIRDGETVFVGIVDDFDSSDDYDFATGEGVLRGVDARSILGWRTIIPPAGSAVDVQSNVPAQDAIRHYVENNLTNPTDTTRDIDNDLGTPTFLIEAGSIGLNVIREERYSNLMNVCFEIARTGDIWFDVTITSGLDYQLRFHAPVDKTAGPSGDAVIFSTVLNTALSLEWTVSRRGYNNAVIVLGQRVGDFQTTYTETDIDNGSMFRREQIISGGSVRTSAVLTIEDTTQWWTDFSEYPETAASNNPGPPGWTRRWDTPNMSVNVKKGVNAPTGATGDAALEMIDRTPTGGGRFALSSDFPNNVSSPVEILTKAQYTVNENNAMMVVVHGSGSGNLNENSYQLSAHDDVSLDWSIAKLVEGTGSGLHNVTTDPIADDVWYWIRLRREGRDIQGKIWQDGTSEPAFVTIEDPAHDEGWMGIARWAVASPSINNKTWFDVVGFAWDGSTAPSSLTETVTIGATTYTFSHDMTIANNILRDLSGDILVANLAAAINGDAGEGTIYGTGTTAHPDVVAIPNGRNLTVLAKGTSGLDIAVSAGIHNGTWDTNTIRVAPLVEIAQEALAVGAERIRSYQAIANPITMPYKTSVETGDIVSVDNRSLAVVDDRLVRTSKVTVDVEDGERVLFELGDLPITLLDMTQRNQRDIDGLLTER